jgi:oligopeptide transport system substrate-binding protein
MLRLLVIPLTLIALLIGAMFWSGGAHVGRADFAFIDRGDIITLDPNQMSYVQDFRISYAIREGLYAYDPQTLAPKPADALSVDVTPDKRTWTFHLRPEARWTNGDPVRAKDYVFAWRRMIEQPGEYTYLFYYIENAKEYEDAFAAGKPMSFDQVGIKALDPLTLRVTLHNPCGFFLDLVAFVPFYPLSERSMEPFKRVDPQTGRVSYDPEFTRPPHVVTNGPFVLKRWDFTRDLWLEKSPTYWDRKHVALHSIEMVINNDSLSQMLMYESGAVDWLADIPSDFAAELKARGRKDLVITPGFGTVYLDVNCARDIPGVFSNNPLADVRVRQALDMAIDKQQICDVILRHMGETPATTYIPPNIFAGYHTTPGFGFNVNRARKLLAQAGYPEGRGFPVLPMLYSTATPAWLDLVQDIKNQLQKNLHVNIDLQGMESRTASIRLHGKQYVIGPSDWIGDYGDPSTFTDKCLSTAINNDSNWAVPQYDSLCAQAAREPDNAKRMRLLEQAENLIDTDLPIIPLYYLINTDLCRPYVKIHFNPRMTISFKGIRIER